VDSFKHAVDLAKAADGSARQSIGASSFVFEESRHGNPAPQIRREPLDTNHLETSRIVAHDPSGASGRYYDMLRTQILQEMDKKSWQFLAVTSPTAGCGKSVTACNLALSVARLSERSVLLVDLDLRRPAIASYLGLGRTDGVLDVLEGRTTLSSAVIEASVGPNAFFVLPGSVSTSSSEWMASQTMGTMLQAIKRDFRACVVIFDLPPLLLGDDVISILPRMDATILVTAVGSTSNSDIQECQKHFKRNPVVRVVVNKATEKIDSYYGYY
jgi:capsular exopolysaccharide synthesis family protein